MAEGNNLVVNSGKFRIARLSELSAEYYLDTSGSTSGSVLTYERKSAILLSRVIRPSNIFTWNTTAQKVADLKDVKQSEGGTDPSCFVQYLNRPQCLVVYTDGQISEYAMDRFRDAMRDKLEDVPVIIGFAMSSFAVHGHFNLSKSTPTFQPRLFNCIEISTLVLFSTSLFSL